MCSTNLNANFVCASLSLYTKFGIVLPTTDKIAVDIFTSFYGLN